jgi:LPS sulfotransferase NodH
MQRFYFRHQTTSYVIFFIERDGSTYLTSLLASHPQVRSVYERFAVMKERGEDAREQLDWARAFLKAPLVGRFAARGFKTKLVDVLDREGLAGLLRELNCRALQMKRRNHVKAVVSRINARRLYEANGKWNLSREEDRLPPAEIDPDEFSAYLAERQRGEEELEAYVERLAIPTLRLVYEDLLQTRDQTLQEVLSFLRVRAVPLEGRTLKQTNDDLRQVILNFDELRSGFVGTRYEPMFDEVLVPVR